VFARPFELIALARYNYFVFYLLLFFFNTLFDNQSLSKISDDFASWSRLLLLA
jgi:hypothetical protein